MKDEPEEAKKRAVVSKHLKKQIRELRRDLEELNKGLVRAESLKQWEEVNAGELERRVILEEDLRVLETNELEDQARPFGINLFPGVRQIGDPRLSETTSDNRRVLTEEGMARARNLITDARMTYWKRWIDIVAPLASTIISIIALIIAALALYLQIYSDPIIVVPPVR